MDYQKTNGSSMNRYLKAITKAICYMYTIKSYYMKLIDITDNLLVLG